MVKKSFTSFRAMPFFSEAIFLFVCLGTAGLTDEQMTSLQCLTEAVIGRACLFTPDLKALHLVHLPGASGHSSSITDTLTALGSSQ